MIFAPYLLGVRSPVSACMAGAGIETAGCLQTKDFGGAGGAVADPDFLLEKSAYVT